MTTDSNQNFGGNLVSTANMQAAETTFATTPYIYRHFALNEGQSASITLPSCTVFVQSCTPSAVVTLGNLTLAKGDSVLLENTPCTLSVTGGSASVLLAGVETPAYTEASVKHIPASQQYKVSKPWGYELWLNGEHPAYVLKELFLLQGKRTSLQYHDIKRETVVMVGGTAGLVYKANSAVENMEALEADLGRTTLTPGSVLNTFPGTIHRMVAETDILYYEASTPHLDDVVRVHDDSGRGQGRIQSEHQNAA